MITQKNNKLSAFFSVLKYLVIFLSCLSMITPFLWMISSSFKDSLDVFSVPFQWIPDNPSFQNFIYIWEEANYLRLFWNTFKVTLITTVVHIITSSLVAYAFSKIDFPESKKLFILYISTLMLPYQVVMIPQFAIIRSMGLANTHAALVLVHAFNALGVFILKQFFDGIPNELSEAARIDGLGHFGIYSRIIMPLSKSGISTLVILTSVSIWNDFLPPLIYINSEHLFTIQLGLRNMISENAAEYGPIMAASVISIIPILIVYLAFQSTFENSIVSSGIKG